MNECELMILDAISGGEKMGQRKDLNRALLHMGCETRVFNGRMVLRLYSDTWLVDDVSRSLDEAIAALLEA